MTSTILSDPTAFDINLNRKPFPISHRMAESCLFDLPRLLEVAQRVANRKSPHRPFGDFYCNIGETYQGDAPAGGGMAKASVDEVLHKIQDAQAWINMNHIEREPGYRELMEECMCDLLELSSKTLRKRIKWFEAILFITSPLRKTAYHIDRECAWLLQLRGNKQIHLFDKADKDVVPDEELERFWAVDNSAGVYKPQFESRAMVFDMHPGDGVHIPVNCPHWVQNGDNISVSMNINFQLHDSAWGNIYKTNYHLRKRGLRPHAPGTHPLLDDVKSLAYTAVQGVSRKMKGKQYIPADAKEEYDRVMMMLRDREQKRTISA